MRCTNFSKLFFGVELYNGQKTSPKHVEFYSKNKFEKLVHLVGFIIQKLLWLRKIPFSSGKLVLE